MRKLTRFTLALATSLLSTAAVADVLPFGPDSMQAIERVHTGTPFLVVLWATDCAPCRRDFEVLETFVVEHPQIPIVLIATDNMHNAALANRIVAGYALAEPEMWLFADGNVERLRYAVDPDWFGEVPRSYFYDEAAERTAESGTLTLSRLEEWLASVH